MNYELCIMNCRDAFLLESEKSQGRKTQGSRFKAQSSKFKVQSSKKILKFSDSQILRFKKIPPSVVCCLWTFYYLCSLLIYIIYNPYL